MHSFRRLRGSNRRALGVYLGAIHNMGTFTNRLAVARKFLPDFGLGAYCGFGRLPPSELPEVLADHIKAVEIAGS